MLLLVMKRKEKEKEQQSVGVEDGRGVENDARLEKMESMGQGEVGICGMVDQHECQTTKCVGYIDPEGVPNEGCEIADKRKSFHAAKVGINWELGVRS